MKIDTVNRIIAKAKSKPNGVYRFMGIRYGVQDSGVNFLWSGGKLYQLFGFGVVEMGDVVDYLADSAIKKAIVNYYKS